METIDEAEETRRGELIVQMLHLKKAKWEGYGAPRYETEWGTKTPLGLFRTLQRIIEKGE